MFEHGFPSDWSTFKKLIWLVGSGIAGASYIWKTVTGTLIHITDALASPMQKCEVTLEPIQDLHGQDAPYPAGGGVNKLDESAYTSLSQVTYSNGVFSSTSEPETRRMQRAFVRTFLNNATINTYEFDVTNKNDGVRAIFTIPFDGSFDSFDVGYKMTSPYNDAARFSATGIANGTYTISFYCDVIPKTNEILGKFSRIQLELGSTATSYSPYSNICPITGWTGCEAHRTGVNLFDKDATWTSAGNYILNDNGVKVSDGSSSYFLEKLPVKPNTTYYSVGGAADNGTQRIYFYDRNGVFISRSIAQNYGFSFTTPSNCYYIGFQYKTSALNLSAWSINYPSTDTGYHAYNGTTLSVTFPNGQTVYGGTVDLVSGVLKSKMASVDLGTLNWGKSDQFFEAVIANRSNGIGLCSNYKFYGTVQYPTIKAHMPDKQFAFTSNSSRKYIEVYDTAYSSASDFKTAMSGVQLVYELAEPAEISLTPQEISTLRGENNVWSNTNGDTTVIYKAQA